MRWISLWGVLVVVAGCPADQPLTVVVVTVDAMPQVSPAQNLTVDLRNGSDRISHMFMAGPISFPTSFSVTPHERTGALIIDAVATAGDGRTARASGQIDIRPDARVDLQVTLLPDDFVLNSRRSGNQVPSFGLGQRQVGAAQDGSITLIYEDDCPQQGICNIWGRLFDSTGTPRNNAINGDDTDFIFNSNMPAALTQPALGVAPSGGFAGVWKVLSTPQLDMRARVFQPDGTALGAGDFTILVNTSADVQPDDVSMAARPDGSFVVTWSEERNNTPGTAEPRYVRARILSAQGTSGSPFVVNQPNPASGGHANDDHLASYTAVSADGSFVVAWVRGLNTCSTNFGGPCEARARFFDPSGSPGAEVTVSSAPTGFALLPVAAALPDGYLIAWADTEAPGSGPDTDSYAIVARRFDKAGQPKGSDFTVNTLVTAMQAFPAAAALPDGRALIVWEDDSGTQDDKDGPGIRGRALLPFGLPVGDDFLVNTTTQGNQIKPSLTALRPASETAPGAFFAVWADASMQQPDTDGAVRGRFVYPLYDRSDGVLGAGCGQCGTNLVCVQVSGAGYCHLGCMSGMNGMACPQGGTCRDAGGSKFACLFP